MGLEETELGIRHMMFRAMVVFCIAVIIVRLGEKRFISKNTAFDVILGVMLGSVSRAITGQSPFVPTLCAALVLVGMHFKGSTRILIQNGKVD